MFGTIGFTEILLIAAVALVILGPEKFPGHAKIAMRFIRDIRGYWDEAKRDLTEELKPVKKEIKELEKYKPEDYLESMTADSSEDTNYDGQGYPYGENSKESKSEGPAETTENKAEEPQDKTEDESAPVEPADDAGVAGTTPYAPDKDYADDSERFPD